MGNAACVPGKSPTKVKEERPRSCRCCARNKVTPAPRPWLLFGSCLFTRPPLLPRFAAGTTSVVSCLTVRDGRPGAGTNRGPCTRPETQQLHSRRYRPRRTSGAADQLRAGVPGAWWVEVRAGVRRLPGRAGATAGGPPVRRAAAGARARRPVRHQRRARSPAASCGPRARWTTARWLTWPSPPPRPACPPSRPPSGRSAERRAPGRCTCPPTAGASFSLKQTLIGRRCSPRSWSRLPTRRTLYVAGYQRQYAAGAARCPPTAARRFTARSTGPDGVRSGRPPGSRCWACIPAQPRRAAAGRGQPLRGRRDLAIDRRRRPAGPRCSRCRGWRCSRGFAVAHAGQRRRGTADRRARAVPHAKASRRRTCTVSRDGGLTFEAGDPLAGAAGPRYRCLAAAGQPPVRLRRGRRRRLPDRLLRRRRAQLDAAGPADRRRGQPALRRRPLPDHRHLAVRDLRRRLRRPGRPERRPETGDAAVADAGVQADGCGDTAAAAVAATWAAAPRVAGGLRAGCALALLLWSAARGRDGGATGGAREQTAAAADTAAIARGWRSCCRAAAPAAPTRRGCCATCARIWPATWAARSTSTSSAAPRWGASTPASWPAPPTSPAAQGRLLAERWESLVLEEVVHFGVKEFMKTPGHPARQRHASRRSRRARSAWAASSTPRMLERIVRRLIPWQRISAQLRERAASSRCRSPPPTSARASRWCSCESSRPLPPWSQDPFVRVQAVKMVAEHAIASAAIPILFPGHRHRRALLLRRGPAPEHAAVAGAAAGGGQGAGGGPAPQALARRDRPRRRMPFPGRGLPGRQGAQRLPARPHRLRPRSPAPLQRPHRRRQGGRRRGAQAPPRRGGRPAPAAPPTGWSANTWCAPRSTWAPSPATWPAPAASRARAAAPASACCAGWPAPAAPARPTCCRTSSSTASTPPSWCASATRTPAPATTSWPTSSATASSRRLSEPGYFTTLQLRALAAAAGGGGGAFVRAGRLGLVRRASAGTDFSRRSRLAGRLRWRARLGAVRRRPRSLGVGRRRRRRRGRRRRLEARRLAGSSTVPPGARRSRRRRGAGDQRHVLGHVLVVEDAAAVGAGDDVDRRPGDEGLVRACARTTGWRVMPVVVDRRGRGWGWACRARTAAPGAGCR